MNRVNIIGRICTDLEVQILEKTGTKILKTVIALNGMKKDDGTYFTHFIDCEAFGKTAEMIEQSFKKGELIAIDGSIKTNNYEKSNGTKIKQTSVLIEKITFIKSKKATEDTITSQTQNIDNFTKNTTDDFTIGAEDLPF